MQDKRVGISSTAGKVYSCGIAQVCIPHEVDRDKFVKSCLTTGMISIQPAINNAIHRVRCDKSVLQNLNFPVKSTELGSYVIFVNEPKTKIPFVIASFDSIREYHDLSENQFKLERSTEFGYVTILGDGNGRLLMNVQSEVEKKGQFDINITNPDDSSQFNVNTRGTTNLYSSDSITIQTNNEALLQATDGADLSSSISITKDRINLDNGTEPMLLGQSTIDLLRQFINLVATATNSGGPLSNASQISQLANELDSLLSQKANLD